MRSYMTKRETRGLFLFLVLAFMAVCIAENAEFNPGLKKGSKAPPFRLKDASGETRTLDRFLEKGPVAVVFYRSADW